MSITLGPFLVHGNGIVVPYTPFFITYYFYC